MASTAYSAKARGSSQLKPEMISTGDILNMIVNPPYGSLTLEPVTVVKKLKTRLVVQRENGNQIRFIVKDPNYHGGYVTGRVEKTDYRSETYDLYTADDENYKPILEGSQRRFAKERAKNEALSAFDDFRRSGSSESVDATIAALTTWRELDEAETRTMASD